MRWVLGIDTSHFVAAGISSDGEPVARAVVADTRAHVEQAMPLVQQVCLQAGIELTHISSIAVGMGPGPFTGLRVGIATAEALATALHVPLRRICSLDVLAAAWHGAPTEFVVASDARRRELYWARYAHGQRQGEPQVSSAAELPSLPVVGPVPEIWRAELDWVAEGPQELDPAVLAALSGQLPQALSTPYYLRPADATVGGPPKSALPRLKVER